MVYFSLLNIYVTTYVRPNTSSSSRLELCPFPLVLALPFWHLHKSGSSTERPKGGRRCRSIMEIIVCRGNPAGYPDARGGLDRGKATKMVSKIEFWIFLVGLLITTSKFKVHQRYWGVNDFESVFWKPFEPNRRLWRKAHKICLAICASLKRIVLFGRATIRIIYIYNYHKLRSD